MVAVLGWILGHFLTGMRDLAFRRREARLKCLEAAYLRLANASNRTLNDVHMTDIESFVSEIQLYGTPKQFELLGPIVEGFMKPNNPVRLDPMLLDLRDTIRKELKLEPLPASVWWFRFNRDPPSPKANEPNDA